MSEKPRTLAESALVLVERIDSQRAREDWPQAIREALLEVEVAVGATECAPPPCIVIEIVGGQVSTALATEPARVVVLDYDCPFDNPSPVEVPQDGLATVTRRAEVMSYLLDDEGKPRIAALLAIIDGENGDKDLVPFLRQYADEEEATAQPPADEITPALTEALGGKPGLAEAAAAKRMQDDLRSHGFEIEGGGASAVQCLRLDRNGWVALVINGAGDDLPAPGDWRLSLYTDDQASGGTWEPEEEYSSEEGHDWSTCGERVLDRMSVSPDRKSIYVPEAGETPLQPPQAKPSQPSSVERRLADLRERYCLSNVLDVEGLHTLFGDLLKATVDLAYDVRVVVEGQAK